MIDHNIACEDIKALEVGFDSLKELLFTLGLFLIMPNTKTILNENLGDVWAKVCKCSDSSVIKILDPGRFYTFYYIIARKKLSLINLFVDQEMLEMFLGNIKVDIINTLYLIRGYRAYDIGKHLKVNDSELREEFNNLKKLFGVKSCMHLKILLMTKAPEFALSQETLSGLGVKLNDLQINLLRMYYLGMRDKVIMKELKLTSGALADKKKALIAKLGANDMADAVSLVLGEAHQITRFDPQRICDLLNQRQTEDCFRQARAQGGTESESEGQSESESQSRTEVQSRSQGKGQIRGGARSPRKAQSPRDLQSRGGARKKRKNSGKNA
ncbi:MAG: hypothetical protein LBE49_05645 [Deltaproteobacteria bacterium]|jgi:hypothetical protein|nr:hypothetical protein [Deltaproteobacteria bacterium]